MAQVQSHDHDGSHGYRFCPMCGGTLEQRRMPKAGEPDRPVCTRCGFIVYLDPKIAVGTIIKRDDRLVLVRRAIEPGYGKWIFPSGYVDRGEHLADAAVREAREESGLEVRLDGLINIYSYRGAIPVIVVYAATATGGTLAVDDEGLEIAEFPAATLPWHELAFRSTGEALKDYLAGILHPVRP